MYQPSKAAQVANEMYRYNITVKADGMKLETGMQIVFSAHAEEEDNGRTTCTHRRSLD